MIKEDRWIQYMADYHQMITPFVAESVSTDPAGNKIFSYGLSSFGYDLRAKDEWKIFKPEYSRGYIDPHEFNPDNFDTVKDQGFCIIPGNSYALTSTLEHISMPRNVTGIVLGKSSLARVGVLINVTPIESAWRGHITIEIANLSPVPVKIRANEGLCQLLFFEGQQPITSYADRKGKYQDQAAEVVHAKLKEN